MYEIIRQVIENGGYKLAEMQVKIKRMYMLGDLTDAQMDQLLTLAEAGAAADAERPETIIMLKSLSDRLKKVEDRLDAIEGGDEVAPQGYPEWTAWDGVSSNYQPGAIVSHNGKLWQSVYNGQNVWEPGLFGTGLWVEYAG